MRKIFAVLMCVMWLSSSTLYAQAAKAQKQFTGNDWLKLSNKSRIETVSSFITSALKKGIVIKETPSFYVQHVDVFFTEHPELKKEGVANVLKTVMIMEYDWDEKGADRDAVAKEWLEEELYKKNKARRGLK